MRSFLYPCLRETFPAGRVSSCIYPNPAVQYFPGVKSRINGEMSRSYGSALGSISGQPSGIKRSPPHTNLGAQDLATQLILNTTVVATLNSNPQRNSQPKGASNSWNRLIRTVTKSDSCIPRNETARPRSHIIHSCICERFIYSQDRSAYLAAK